MSTAANKKSIVSSINLHLNTLRGYTESNAVTIKFRIKLSVLCAAITAIWLLFTLPVVFYHLQQPFQGVTNDSTYEFANFSGIAAKTALNCSQGFSISFKTGRCSPVCGEWEEFSHSSVVAFKVTNSLLYAIHFIGAVIAFALSCYNYKIM